MGIKNAKHKYFVFGHFQRSPLIFSLNINLVKSAAIAGHHIAAVFPPDLQHFPIHLISQKEHQKALSGKKLMQEMSIFFLRRTVGHCYSETLVSFCIYHTTVL